MAGTECLSLATKSEMLLKVLDMLLVNLLQSLLQDWEEREWEGNKMTKREKKKTQD